MLIVQLYLLVHQLFFLKYAKDLCIVVIKAKEFKHTNDATSALGGLQVAGGAGPS